MKESQKVASLSLFLFILLLLVYGCRTNMEIPNGLSFVDPDREDP